MTRKRKPNITPEDVGTLYTTDGVRVYRLEVCETEPYATMIPLGNDVTLVKPISEFANFVRLRPERPIHSDAPAPTDESERVAKPPAARKVRSDAGKPRERKPKASDRGFSPRAEQALPSVGWATTTNPTTFVRLEGEGVPVPSDRALRPRPKVSKKKAKLPGKVAIIQKETPATAAVNKVDISTFKISTDDKGYILSLGTVASIASTLEAGMRDLLALTGIDRKYVEDAPDSEGKRLLLSALGKENKKEGVKDDYRNNSINITR